MFKKPMSMLIAAAVLISSVPAMAQENDSTVSVTTMEEIGIEKIELSLEDAIGMATESNARIQAADASVKSAELSLEVAKETGKEYRDAEKLVSKIPGVSMAVDISDGLEQAYLKHGYYTDAATVGVELAQMSREQVVASISYEVTERYYNVKLMEELVSIANAGLSLAKDNLAMMENQFEAGYVPALEVRNAKNAVLRAEYSLKNYERSLEVVKKSLKVSLGIGEADCDIVLTDKLEMPEIPGNAEEMIEGALTARYDMTAVKKNYELMKSQFDITAFYMSEKTAAYHSAYSEYLSAEYTYNNTLDLMKIGLESEYAAILTAADEITACENDLEIAQSLYESKKTMYDLGLITNLELTSAMTELDSSKMQLENARVSYALAVIKFGYSTTIGI